MKETYKGFTIKYSDKDGIGVFAAVKKDAPKLYDYELYKLKKKINAYLNQFQPEKVRIFDRDNFTHAWFSWSFDDAVFKGMDEYGESMIIEVTFHDGSKGRRDNSIILKDIPQNREIEKEILEIHEKHKREKEEYEKQIKKLFDNLEKFKPRKGTPRGRR